VVSSTLKLQTTLNPRQALSENICLKLLLRLHRCQVSDVFRIAATKRCPLPRDLKALLKFLNARNEPALAQMLLCGNRCLLPQVLHDDRSPAFQIGDTILDPTHVFLAL